MVTVVQQNACGIDQVILMSKQITFSDLPEHEYLPYRFSVNGYENIEQLSRIKRWLRKNTTSMTFFAPDLLREPPLEVEKPGGGRCTIIRGIYRPYLILPRKEMYIVLHHFEYMTGYMVPGALHSLCDYDYVRLHGVCMRKDGADWYIVTMYDSIASRRAMFSRAMNSLKDFKNLLFALLLSLLRGL